MDNDIVRIVFTHFRRTGRILCCSSEEWTTLLWPSRAGAGRRSAPCPGPLRTPCANKRTNLQDTRETSFIRLCSAVFPKKKTPSCTVLYFNARTFSGNGPTRTTVTRHRFCHDSPFVFEPIPKNFPSKSTNEKQKKSPEVQKKKKTEKKRISPLRFPILGVGVTFLHGVHACDRQNRYINHIGFFPRLIF